MSIAATPLKEEKPTKLGLSAEQMRTPPPSYENSLSRESATTIKREISHQLNDEQARNDQELNDLEIDRLGDIIPSAKMVNGSSSAAESAANPDNDNKAEVFENYEIGEEYSKKLDCLKVARF
jgi:hypothetical protein